MFILLLILINTFVPCYSFGIVVKQYHGRPFLNDHSRSWFVQKWLSNRRVAGPMHQHDKLMEQVYSGEDGTSNELTQNYSSGYRFGDITRSLGQMWSNKVNELTGKDTYQFGDLTRWIDGRAKERVQAVQSQAANYTYEFGDLMLLADTFVKEKAANFAGKESAGDYQFGDVTKTVILRADMFAKEKAANFAGKESADDYQFGDVTKAIIQKVLSGEYDSRDVYLALRILAVAGFTLLPAAEMLPVKALIEIFECGLINDVAGRLLPVLAVALDRRMKEALTGNADYQLGDITKERLKQQLASFTGKVTYEFGDIARSVVEKVSRSKNEKDMKTMSFSLNDKLLSDDLEAWDQKYLDQIRGDVGDQRR